MSRTPGGRGGEKQVPPPRRPVRSGSGRNDKIVDVRLRFLWMTIWIKVKSKVKGVGQECPIHTSRIRIEVKRRCYGTYAFGRCTAARLPWAAG
jgi:hypothetical protein